MRARIHPRTRVIDIELVVIKFEVKVDDHREECKFEVSVVITASPIQPGSTERYTVLHKFFGR